LKFGVDKLFEAEDETDVDFKKILGPCVAGEWQLEEGPPDAATQEPVSSNLFCLYSIF
jgi:hypothetical protein